ncbi:MAG: hypothetical protein JNM56_07645 [Planctomycetia bacterium]|nr:hypothetical protein [Planctomycetia bacterium]
MGQYVFVEEKFSNSPIVKGTTAFAEKDHAPIRDTGVYLPPQHDFKQDTVNVVLWFHGFYVQNVRDLLHPDSDKMDMKLRESVLRAGKDTILVAPWLGLKSSSDSGSLDLASLNVADGCGVYLDQVLNGIARLRQALSGSASSALHLGKLVIAGHSAGGALMRAAGQHLGKYKDHVKEYWGFDCFYDELYPSWARENPRPDKVFYVGDGSGAGGRHAFQLMKQVYGTPKRPLARSQALPRMYVAPAVDRVYTADDDVAFQSIIDVTDWSPAGPNVYTDVRKATDPLLDSYDHSVYWTKLFPKLSGHFHVVRDLLGPRIKQSQWL